MTQANFTILVDTREQTPWVFRRGRGCLGTKTATLKTADYTLEGLEGHIALERKKSVTEVATNLFEDRFERELVRLASFPVARVVCDFPFSDVVDYPRVPAVPPFLRRRVRLTGAALVKRLNELWLEHPVPWVFTGSPRCSQLYALSLFKRILERPT